jgi:hypothetical protein
MKSLLPLAGSLGSLVAVAGLLAAAPERPDLAAYVGASGARTAWVRARDLAAARAAIAKRPTLVNLELELDDVTELVDTPMLVLARRAVETRERTGSPLAVPTRLQEPDDLPSLGGRHHLFPRATFNDSFSSANWATSFRSFVFSSSRRFFETSVSPCRYRKRLIQGRERRPIGIYEPLFVCFGRRRRIDLIPTEHKDAAAISRMTTDLQSRLRDVIGNCVSGVPAVSGVADIIQPKRRGFVAVVGGIRLRLWQEAGAAAKVC